LWGRREKQITLTIEKFVTNPTLMNVPKKPNITLALILATSLALVHYDANAAIHGLIMDESGLPGTDPANQATASTPAGYVPALGVANASGTLFTGTINGVNATATYAFTDGANWRIDPEIYADRTRYAYDGVNDTSALRLVPRLDIRGATGPPSLDVTITFDTPVSNLRMYMFWMDHSQLQFTDANTISINNSYVQDPAEPGLFSYDPVTRTISDADARTRTANANGNSIEGGGVGAEIDFNGGGPTSLISFTITDNSPLITATHDSIDWAFATVPEPSSFALLISLACMGLLPRRRRRS
jgi:hypothetical protein